jgi:hypothetical protein
VLRINFLDNDRGDHLQVIYDVIMTVQIKLLFKTSSIYLSFNVQRNWCMASYLSLHTASLLPNFPSKLVCSKIFTQKFSIRCFRKRKISFSCIPVDHSLQFTIPFYWPGAIGEKNVFENFLIPIKMFNSPWFLLLKQTTTKFCFRTEKQNTRPKIYNGQSKYLNGEIGLLFRFTFNLLFLCLLVMSSRMKVKG